MSHQIPGRVIGKPLFKWELVLKDSFNFELLYKKLHEYLPEEDWEDLYRGSDDYETMYYEKDNGGGAVSHDIWWRAKKKPKNDLNGKLMFYFKMDIKTLVLKKKEVMIDGKKVKLDNGELGVNCWFYLDVTNNDYDKKWMKHPILKHFPKFFERNKDMRAAIEFAEVELKGQSDDLQTFFETYTGARPEEGPKDFLPVKGIHP